MDDDQKFHATADACLKAYKAVAEAGTPAMLAMMRSLLWQIGQELARREERRKERLRLAENEMRHDDP